MRSCLFVILFILSAVICHANDSISPALPDTTLTYKPRIKPKSTKRDLVQIIADYIGSANKPRPAKKFDFSIIGGPYYTSDTKLGIGIVAAGVFRKDLNDTITPPSQLNIYGDVSINGYYKVGVRGNNIFGRRGKEFTYDFSFESAPDKFWGIGYKMNSNNANETRYKRWHANADLSLLFRIAPDLYAGPRLLLDFLNGKEITRPELWEGQDSRTFTDGIGASLVYDTRDNPFNAYSGLYLRMDQIFAPRFIGNKYAFSLTEITLCQYQKLWKGAILASRIHTRLTYGNTPWGLMSKFGGSYTMRGYWEGRYNDKCSADVTVELRQHIWRRNGLVIWGGIGEVFPKVNGIFRGQILYNFGIGYRWEFKKRINVRLDYGFGRGESGLIFSINEAF